MRALDRARSCWRYCFTYLAELAIWGDHVFAKRMAELAAAARQGK